MKRIVKNKVFKYLIFGFGLFICFSLGFLFNTIMNMPGPDKILDIEDELNFLKSDRDFIINPQLPGSNLVFDSFFLSSIKEDNNKNKIKEDLGYEFIFNIDKSKEKKALCFDFRYPDEYIKNLSNWVILIFTNLGQLNKPEGLINLNKYSAIQIPVYLKMDQDSINPTVQLSAVVSKKQNIFSRRLLQFQYVCTKEIPVDSNGFVNIIFPFKDFKLDDTYQPIVPLSRLKRIENIKLSNNNYRGFLFQFQMRLLFETQKSDSIASGDFYVKNPIVFSNNFMIFNNFISYLYGFICLLIFLFFWFLFDFYKNISNKMIEIKTIENFVNKKENEIKELETSISRKVEIEKEIIEGIRGYYHWELNINHESGFKGVNKEDFFSNKFLNSFYFENYQKNIDDKTIILIIDYDHENMTNHNYLFYYYKDGTIKFPSINITRKSYWFYLLAFLIQTPSGYIKMDKLDYNNILFNNIDKPLIPCLRIPQNNYDLGIDNEKYLEMIKRYKVNNIIEVNRKQKEQVITYSLSREINYALFIHSKFVNHSAFFIKNNCIIDLNP